MFKNRIRLPFFLSKPQFPVERNVFRKADGSSKLLSAIIKNTYEGKTDHLPEDWHRKLVIALTHDEVTIEDNRMLSDVVLDGDYSIEWQDFLQYPVAQSTFTIQTSPFNASNSNCQTCEEISQLELVDDTTAAVFEEGTTNDYPVLVTANDTICCYPFTITISTFNTLYFDSVTVAQDGTLTVTVKDPVPVINDVWIATYRVTCENGGYDEADVYGNINGTSTECVQVTNMVVDSLSSDGTEATITWNGFMPAPAGGYDWYLYLASDIYTVIQSGNTGAFISLVLSGLTPGEDYVFAVVTNCGGGSVSAATTVSFTTPTSGGSSCGSFRVIYTGEGASGTTYTYFDCAGSPTNDTFGAGYQVRFKCMLMDSDTFTPIFFTSDSEFISYEYIGLC